MTIANGGKIERTGGDDLPGAFAVPAGEEAELYTYFGGAEASDAPGDVVATAVFTENMTGRQLTSTTTITAVRAELEADVVLSERTRHRHVFGVAEAVVRRTYPSSVPGLLFRAGKGSLAVSGLEAQWTCPTENYLDVGGLTMECNGETIYLFNTITIPPSGIEAWHCVGYDFGIPAGVAGGAGMLLNLHVLPDYVSFSNIALAEVPTTTGVPSGYFTNSVFSAVWHHTTEMGAGEWYRIIGINGNYWFDDKPRMGDVFYPRETLEWADGTIVWDVPVAWDIGSKPDASKTYDRQLPIIYRQTFNFSSGGTLRVSKHGFWVERDADNTKRGSEGVSTWIEYEEPDMQ